MRLVVCRLGLHWPDTMADGEWECVVCGDVSERRFRIPFPRIRRFRLRWPLVRRSRFDDYVRIGELEREQIDRLEGQRESLRRNVRDLSQDNARVRRLLEKATSRALAVDVLVRRLSGVEAERLESGAGGDIAHVTVLFPALPEPYDVDLVAERLARELAPYLREPGYWKRTCDLTTTRSAR